MNVLFRNPRRAISRLHHRFLSASPAGAGPAPPHPREAIFAFGVGCVAGLGGSLAGMGGAFFAVPFLVSPNLPFKLSQHAANGTTMAVALCTSIGSVLSYSQKTCENVEVIIEHKNGATVEKKTVESRHVHFPTAIGMGAAGFIFAIFGARFSRRLSEKMLKQMRGLMMICIAPTIPAREYIHSLKGGAQGGEKKEDDEMLQYLEAFCIGSLSGFQAGLFGVGGGAIAVPAMCLFTDLPFKTVLGTSMAAMLPTAISGSLTHLKQGTMVLRLAGPLGIGCLIGSYMGGNVAKVVDEKSLRLFFSVVMLVLGVKTLRK